MKRTIAAGLCALLLCGAGAPAYAAGTPAKKPAAAQEEQKPVALTFDTLEQTVRENNVLIKSYESTVKSEEVTDVSDDYKMEYLNASGQIASYQRQVAELEAAIAGLSEQQSALRQTLMAQLASLQASLSSAQASYDAIDDRVEDAEEAQEHTIRVTRREMQNNADQICMDAQNNYIALETLGYSVSQNERSIAQTERSIAATKIQVSLGAVSANTLKTLENQRESLLANRKSLQVQYDSLQNALAIQCGYAVKTTLETAALPLVTDEQLDEMDYDADLAEALKNSYSLWSKQDAADSASDDYANGVTNNLYAFEAAKIALNAERESVTASFRKLYQDVQEKRKAIDAAQSDLAQAQKNFDVQKLQYERGMISRLTYQQAEDTFATAQETAAAAQSDLLTSYNTYRWAKRGVMSAAAV